MNYSNNHLYLNHSLINDMDLETTGRIASMMGSKKISCHGTQNHSFTLDEFKSYFKDHYGYNF